MSLIKKTALAAALSVYPFAANAQIDNWVEECAMQFTDTDHPVPGMGKKYGKGMSVTCEYLSENNWPGEELYNCTPSNATTIFTNFCCSFDKSQTRRYGNVFAQNCNASRSTFTLHTDGDHPSCESGKVWVTTSGGEQTVGVKWSAVGPGGTQSGRFEVTAADTKEQSTIKDVTTTDLGADVVYSFALESGTNNCGEGACRVAFSPVLLEVFRCEDPSDKGIAPFYAGKMQSGYCLRTSSSEGGVCGKHDILGSSIKIKSKGNARYLKSDGSAFAVPEEMELSGLTKYGSQDYYELPAFTSWLTSADENQNGGFVISLEVKDLGSVSTELPFNVSPYAVVHMKPSRQVDCASSCVSPRQIPSDFDANDCWMCDMAAGWTAGSEMSFKYRPMAWCQAAENAVNDAGFVVTDGSVPADCRAPDGAYALVADDETSIELDACADTDAKCQTNYYSVQMADLSMKSGVAEIKNTVDDVGFFDLRIGGYTDPYTGLEVKGSQMRLDAEIVPQGFALQHGDTGGVINSCLRYEEGKKSFTYFGQPFEADFSVEAVNAKGMRTKRFNQDEFADIDLFEVTLAAMPYPSLLPSGMQERGTQRLLLSFSDKNAGTPISQKQAWNSGVLALATPGRASSLQEYKVSLKVLPNGYASDLELGRDDMARHSDGSYIRKYSSDVASKTDDPRGTGSSRAIIGVGVNLLKRDGADVSFMTQKTPLFDYSFRDISSPEIKQYLKSLSAISYSGNPAGNGASFALSAVNGILDLRIGRIALKDAKAAPGNYLFMPVVFEEYRERLDDSGNAVWSGWLRNSDDSCSVLTTRQLYATTMSSDLDEAKKPVALGNGTNFKYKDAAGQMSSSLVLVNERSVSAEALSKENEARPGQIDQYAVASDGLMYLRISPPNLGLPAKLSVGTPAVGKNYERDLPDAVAQGAAEALCAFDDAGYLTADAEWLCFHLENDSAAEGSFDGWPGRQRILFRYDLLPDFARH